MEERLYMLRNPVYRIPIRRAKRPGALLPPVVPYNNKG